MSSKQGNFLQWLTKMYGKASKTSGFLELSSNIIELVLLQTNAQFHGIYSSQTSFIRPSSDLKKIHYYIFYLTENNDSKPKHFVTVITTPQFVAYFDPLGSLPPPPPGSDQPCSSGHAALRSFFEHRGKRTLYYHHRKTQSSASAVSTGFFCMFTILYIYAKTELYKDIESPIFYRERENLVKNDRICLEYLTCLIQDIPEFQKIEINT